MTRKILFSLLIPAVLSIFTNEADATHIRAGDITVERVSCTGLEFVITIGLFSNTGSDIRFGEGTLDFGDGSSLITPTVENSNRPDLGLGVAFVAYSTTHVYGGPGRYVISYLEPNRNAGILNMFNSVETQFYVETVINIDPFLGCNNSPILLVPPVDLGCVGIAWLHNPGAFDPDGDSLSYELAIPKKEEYQFVNNYRDPNEQEFYVSIGLNYELSNENGNGPPTFSIDAETGTLTWDAPGAPGEYNIAFLVKEWRKVSGVWIPLGSVTRDMQIIIEDCDNQKPDLQVPQDVCVEAGTVITEDIFGSDPDFDHVKIEAFSQIFSVSPSPATFTPAPQVFLPTRPPDQAKQTFRWETQCEHVQSQPHQITFKVTDDPPNGPNLAFYKPWNITVVGPAPVWVEAQVDLSTRSASLQWEPYACANAQTMQVWRKVGQFDFTLSECVTGMPHFSGFKKIAEVPIGTTNFIDMNGGKGLAPGAQYCYRLVAAFPDPGGGESYVSQDICTPPILADVPIITHVTVDVTSLTHGAVTVNWTPPFDVDMVRFPPPYEYEVLRSEGFSGDLNLLKPHPGRLSDTTFVDLGLNTKEKIYNYKIIAFDAGMNRIDTSASASTVWLEAGPEFQQINLSWAADVPWSNETEDYPKHFIYRGEQGVAVSQFVLIDSVYVNREMYRYVDIGRFMSIPLEDTTVYCYRVMTQGAYDNPKIKEPLINFSQVVCAQPNDSVPPCTPVLAIIATPCEDYISSASCSQNIFSNTIRWRRPEDPVCRADIRSYNIYVANRVGDAFEPYIQNVLDTFYIDANLPSFARCYKISSVDRSGNESELSEEFCFDNCPYYELPNVFTPNGDPCNEFFSAFGGEAIIDENGNRPCGPIDEISLRRRCSRFVEHVDFTVVDRWGKELYHYYSGGERSIYVDWDGLNNEGELVPGGVYFYSADVVFDVVDPSKKNRVIKGWVQLIR